jgi:hypothetical protein
LDSPFLSTLVLLGFLVRISWCLILFFFPWSSLIILLGCLSGGLSSSKSYSCSLLTSCHRWLLFLYYRVLNLRRFSSLRSRFILIYLILYDYSLSLLIVHGRTLGIRPTLDCQSLVEIDILNRNGSLSRQRIPSCEHKYLITWRKVGDKVVLNREPHGLNMFDDRSQLDIAPLISLEFHIPD